MLEILTHIFDFSNKIRPYVRDFIKIYFGSLRDHFLAMKVSFGPLGVDFAL